MENTLDEFLDRLQPFVYKFSVTKEKLKEVLSDDKELFDMLRVTLDSNNAEDVIAWMVMPLKLYDESFVENNLCRVGKKLGDITPDCLNQTVKTLISAKRGVYISDSFMYEDYMERIALMMPDVSSIDRFVQCYNDCYYEHKGSLEYIATRFPCTQFVKSMSPCMSPAQFMKNNYDTLLNFNVDLFECLITQNISHYMNGEATFCFSDVEKIVPSAGYLSSISEEDFENLMAFTLDNMETKAAKVTLFPLLKSFYEEKGVYKREDIQSLLTSLNQAPTSFFDFLKQNFVEMDVAHFLKNEILTPSNLFSYLSDVSDDDKRKGIYSLLFTGQYLDFSGEQKNSLFEHLKQYNLESIACLNDILDNDAIFLDNTTDDFQFGQLLDFFSSDTEKEFHHKVRAVKDVSWQLDSKYLDRYLWYLKNSNLNSKKEYKAHSAYFKDHSIDKFFSSFSVDDNTWKKDVLLMKTDDKEKKKQQLRLVKKCPTSRLNVYGIYHDVCDTFEYSHDGEKLKNIVNLVVNPLFVELSSAQIEKLLKPFLFRSQTTIIQNGEDVLDVMIPDLDYSLEQLPEQGFVKCKGRGENGTVEVFIGRHSK